MNPKTYLLDEDRGVSPVIGVILMVAITVILAAVIATFVMNMGPSAASPPNANFAWEEESSGGPYKLVHDGGEAVNLDQLTLQSSGSGTLQGGEATASGDVVTGVSSGADITLVWENPNSDQTEILYEGTAPSS